MRELRPGLYGPLPTFFDDDQELDLASYREHLAGSLGEGAHLVGWFLFCRRPDLLRPQIFNSAGYIHQDPSERRTLIEVTRQTLDDLSLTSTPIVAGVGGLSTRETIRLCRDAAAAGADAGLVILPAYYAASLNSDQEQIVKYYVDICEASPIPLFLYNFPTNAAGLDMSSEVIEKIMRAAPNLCGVKLTCGGSIGKLVRLKAAQDGFQTTMPTRRFPFLLLDGLIGDLTAWKACGGHGTVSGIPNFAPRASVRLWELLNTSSPTHEEVSERDKLQAVLSRADAIAVHAGIRAMKFVLHQVHGYGKAPRRPLLPLNEDEGQLFLASLSELLETEREYQKRE
ncbi:uncharacterized protein Z520_02642 [Fonsecaea multimorphosa CBS 102226]|uniref:Dihydrodipicolinate synthase n=1 Tax=Fonsecaea multimorphosa CBS 102226 TaxID=1442371 RepID=A0A0D2KD11_9EURO|nr:uncharacterized protein Z520_02642 [Fonsecaea multimorphosa CBS 102226]KIY01090.1 hypothetical protein Z520_02642 [Fonsecaea multimorphosa CBS 102226]